jgi:3-hydroxybutyryl-CoA dehydrogenase
MEFNNITIAGGGVLGSQIAFQTAFYGYQVTLYDITDEALEKSKKTILKISKEFQADLKVTNAELEAAFKNLNYDSNFASSVKDADLLIEAIPENPKIKTDFYRKLALVAPEKTIFATNSSTLLPSKFAAATGRPSQFLALHFANEIWKHNTAEIMGHSGTSPEVFNKVVAFAKSIGMITLPLHKEQPGYILNSLLVPLLNAATNLLVNEIADAPTIDKTWMAATGAPLGPFGILDIVGITTAYNINLIAAQTSKDPIKLKTVAYLKEKFIDTNKLGVATQEGFYKYPNPEFKEEDFLK